MRELIESMPEELTPQEAAPTRNIVINNRMAAVEIETMLRHKKVE